MSCFTASFAANQLTLLRPPSKINLTMTSIHQKRGWPDLQWNAVLLTQTLAAVRHKQGRLLGKMELTGLDLRSETSLATLTSDVVRSSAIEGEKLKSSEVRSCIARRLGFGTAGQAKTPGQKKPGRAVEGMVEMMLDATQNFEEPLTKERLCGWQAALFAGGRSGINRMTVGDWRTGAARAMQAVSGAIGREKVHFEAPHADRLETEMSQFIDWFNRPPAIDPVLKAGIAHFWFVTIHPFEDGNGRIARAIADMALARADATGERFYSMSSQIEAERKRYDLKLEAGQCGGLDITRWLAWFLSCLDRAIDQAEQTLVAVIRKDRWRQQIAQQLLNDRQRSIVHRMLIGFKGFLSSSKYAKLAKCSTDSALRDIHDLVQRGILLQNPSGGRSTSYRLADAENSDRH